MDTECTDSPESGLKAGLENRMVKMIALRGIVGPGYFIGMGNMLKVNGPVGLKKRDFHNQLIACLATSLLNFVTFCLVKRITPLI